MTPKNKRRPAPACADAAEILCLKGGFTVPAAYEMAESAWKDFEKSGLLEKVYSLGAISIKLSKWKAEQVQATQPRRLRRLLTQQQIDNAKAELETELWLGREQAFKEIARRADRLLDPGGRCWG